MPTLSLSLSLSRRIKELAEKLINYVPSTRKINNKPLSDDITLTAGDVGAAASSHTHDDRYYTENEIDTKLGGKANSSHGNHVPTTESANNARFLRNDNTWQTVTPGNIGAAASNHTHNYAGSSSAGGAATSANKLNTNAGSASEPVYFSNGVPVKCSGISVDVVKTFIANTFTPLLVTPSRLKSIGTLLAGKSLGSFTLNSFSIGGGNWVTLSQSWRNFKYISIVIHYIGSYSYTRQILTIKTEAIESDIANQNAGQIASNTDTPGSIYNYADTHFVFWWDKSQNTSATNTYILPYFPHINLYAIYGHNSL